MDLLKINSNRFQSTNCTIPVRNWLDGLVTAGVPGLLIYMWVLIPQLFTSYRSGDEYANIDRTAIIQLSVIAIGTVYLVLTYAAYQRKIKEIILHAPMVWFFAYCILSILSSVWSVDPLYSLATAHTALVFYLLSIVLCIRYEGNMSGLINWVLWWGIIAGCLPVILKADKQWNTLQSWHGFAIFYISPIMFLALIDYHKFKWHFIFLLIIAVVSTSAKVYLGIVMAIVVYSVFSKKWYLHLAVLLLISLLVIFWALYSNSGERLLAILFWGRDTSVLETANGRTSIYPLFIELVSESPILGYGFAMGEKVAYQKTGIYVSSTHNVFLTSLLYSGISGLVLIGMFWLSLFRSSLQYIKDNTALIFLMCYTVSFVFTVFDQGLGNKIMSSWISQAILCGIGSQWYLSRKPGKK